MAVSYLVYSADLFSGGKKTAGWSVDSTATSYNAGFCGGLCTIKAGIDLFLTGCGRKLWLPGCWPGGIKAVGISKAESSMPFLVVAVVVSSLVFRVAEPKAKEMVARRSEIEKTAQDMVTEMAMTAANLLAEIPFGKDIFSFHQPGRVSNMAPEFEDKPVMEVTAYQIPMIRYI